MKYIFPVVSMLLGINPVHAEEQYPKALRATDAIQYFAQHQEIEMRKPGSGFTLEIRGNKIIRDCVVCNTSVGYGTVKYDNTRNQVCLDWENVSFPDSGCFSFVQVSPGGFELQNKYGKQVYAWGDPRKQVVIKSTIKYREQFERAILIDLEDMNPPKEKIHAALLQAMKNKGWQIEKDTEKSIVASLVRNDTTFRVMAKIRGPWVGLGFVQGFAPHGDGWLYNIQRQLQIQLSGK